MVGTLRDMLKRQMDKLEGELQKIRMGIKTGKLKSKNTIKIERRMELLEWAQKVNGCYLLRTNLSVDGFQRIGP